MATAGSIDIVHRAIGVALASSLIASYPLWGRSGRGGRGWRSCSWLCRQADLLGADPRREVEGVLQAGVHTRCRLKGFLREPKQHDAYRPSRHADAQATPEETF